MIDDEQIIQKISMHFIHLSKPQRRFPVCKQEHD